MVWVFTFPPNQCSNLMTLGGFCQYTCYRTIQNLPEISDIRATGGFGVRSTPVVAVCDRLFEVYGHFSGTLQLKKNQNEKRLKLVMENWLV